MQLQAPAFLLPREPLTVFALKDLPFPSPDLALCWAVKGLSSLEQESLPYRSRSWISRQGPGPSLCCTRLTSLSSSSSLKHSAGRGWLGGGRDGCVGVGEGVDGKSLVARK